jgi:membrane protein DedA with SNARE-associated domain
LFERYGGGFIVLARFLDGARQLNGIVAGILGMRWWIFTAFNVLGALLWVGVWGMGTYYLSEHVQTVDALIQKVNPWFSGFVVLAAVGMILYLLRGRSASTRG